MASKDKKRLRYLEKEIDKYNHKKSDFDSRLQELERRKQDLETLLGKINRVEAEPLDVDFIQQCETVKGHLEALVVTLDQIINEHQPKSEVIAPVKQTIDGKVNQPGNQTTSQTNNQSQGGADIDLTTILQMLNKPEVRQIAEVVRNSLNKG